MYVLILTIHDKQNKIGYNKEGNNEQKGTIAAHTTLIVSQGAHTGSQGSLDRQPRYDVWNERFRE